MKITGKVATLILLILFFVGLSVLLYPALSSYWNARVQTKVVADYESLMDAMNSEDYSEYFQAAYAYNDQLAALKNPYAQGRLLPGYDDLLNLDRRGIMGYISIDKIQVQLPIYHGVTPEVLNVAAGHLPGTSLPVGGVNTHCVLSAHRGLPTAKLFTNLDKMEVGDTFVLTVLGQDLTYEVDQVRIVLPEDLSEIQIVEGKDYCTLLTCTPYGVNSHRLLVRGHRIESVSHKTIYITAEAYQIDRLIVTPIVALPIILILIIYVIFRPVKRRSDDSE